MARPGGLGKGLGALIPAGATEPRPAAGGGPGMQEIDVSAIRPNPYQPRDQFDEEGLGRPGRHRSVRSGCSSPILVRPADDGYELIAGERRWRASRRVGLQRIPALVRETDDGAALEQALVENLQREELNPLEEAGAYQQLIEDFGLTHEQVAPEGRVQPGVGEQHAATARACPRRSSGWCARGSSRWATPGRCSGRPTGRSRSSSPSRSPRRTCRCGPWSSWSGPTTTKRRRRAPLERSEAPRGRRQRPAGHRRARGDARRSPRDPGQDLDERGRQGPDRGGLRRPRGSGADLPQAHRGSRSRSRQISCISN